MNSPESTIKMRSGPRHVAVIMDGNGRWAKAKGLPVAAGHRAGVEAIRRLLDGCLAAEIEAVTLYAFSSENWQRPRPEVRALMALFIRYLRNEVADLSQRGIRIRFIGARHRFSHNLQKLMTLAEQQTVHNSRLNLVIAVDYGGRWDITEAVRLIAADVAAGRLAPAQISEQLIADGLSTAGLPAIDLMVRTGGDHRISNFLLWQLSYAELYFCPCYWPDFNELELQHAIDAFCGRERRFGARPGERVQA